MARKSLKILLVYENKSYLDSFKKIIKSVDSDPEIKTAGTKNTFLSLVKTFNADIVFAYAKLKWLPFSEILETAEKHLSRAAVIAVTGRKNDKQFLSLIDLGASAAISQSDYKSIKGIIENKIGIESSKHLPVMPVSRGINYFNKEISNLLDQNPEGICRVCFNQPFEHGNLNDRKISAALNSLTFTYSNSLFAEMFGKRAAAEVIKLKPFKLLYDILMAFARNIETFLTENYCLRNIETFRITSKNISRHLLTDIIGEADGKHLNCLWIISRDITENKSLTAELQNSEKRFKEIFNYSQFGIYRTSLEGKILDVNPALLKMLGYQSAGELKGVDISKADRAARGRRKEFISYFESHDYIVGFESEWLRKDGSTLFVRESARAVRDEYGKIRFFEGTVEDITDAVSYKHALMESEERFSLLADSAPVMIWLSGADKLFFYFNKYWLDFTGRSLITEIGHGWMENIHPEDVEKFVRFYLSEFDKRNPIELEYRLKRYDGVYRWILSYGSPRYLQNGNFAGYIGTSFDITDRKLMEDALKESEEIYRGVVQSLSEGVLITDLNGRILFVNNGVTELTEYPANELIGESAYKLFKQPKVWELILENSQEHIAADSKGHELEIQKRNKINFWANIKGAPYKNSRDQVIGTIWVINDIHQSKIAAKALHESEENYRTVVKTVREVIFKTDASGVLTFLNPYWSEITGYSIDECIGSLLFDYIVTEDRKKTVDQFIAVVYRKLEFCKLEVRFITSDQKFRWLEINARTIIGDDQNIHGISGTLSDVHERKLTEDELIMARDRAEESDRIKSAFLAQMSHEIRTPLNIILGYSSVLNEIIEKEFTKEYKREFKAIENAGKRLQRTIDLILNMSVVQSGNYETTPELINIHKLFEDMLAEFESNASEKGVAIEFKDNSDVDKITGDLYTLKQAFQNLVDNAIKFTKEGKVTVKIYRKKRYMLSVDISDTGIGISKEYLAKLFEPFTQEDEGYSRRFEGNGLGLALTKKYLDMNGAEISVKSNKDKGTVFTVHIPLTFAQNINEDERKK